MQLRRHNWQDTNPITMNKLWNHVKTDHIVRILCGEYFPK